MKYDPCEYCDGRIKEQKVRVDHWWKGKLFVIENVPTGVCSRCGERYYEAAVLRQLDRSMAIRRSAPKETPSWWNFTGEDGTKNDIL